MCERVDHIFETFTFKNGRGLSLEPQKGDLRTIWVVLDNPRNPHHAPRTPFPHSLITTNFPASINTPFSVTARQRYIPGE